MVLKIEASPQGTLQRLHTDPFRDPISDANLKMLIANPAINAGVAEAFVNWQNKSCRDGCSSGAVMCLTGRVCEWISE